MYKIKIAIILNKSLKKMQILYIFKYDCIFKYNYTFKYNC